MFLYFFSTNWPLNSCLFCTDFVFHWLSFATSPTLLGHTYSRVPWFNSGYLISFEWRVINAYKKDVKIPVWKKRGCLVKVLLACVQTPPPRRILRRGGRGLYLYKPICAWLRHWRRLSNTVRRYLVFTSRYFITHDPIVPYDRLLFYLSSPSETKICNEIATMRPSLLWEFPSSTGNRHVTNAAGAS